MGAQFDEFGTQIGGVLAVIDTFDTTLPTQIHTPAKNTLGGLLFLLGYAARRRRKI